MSDKFTTEILPVVEKWARKRLKDDERVSIAIVLAWYYWSQSEKELSATVWSFVAIRHVLSRRDLPGVKTPGAGRDAMDSPDTWTCGDMRGVIDSHPGPDKIAEDRDQLRKLESEMTHRERLLAEAYLDGATNQEVARLLDVSPARATQLRQEIRRRWFS